MWCNYGAKDELNKGRALANIMSTKATSKQVICLENLLVFESAHDCARQCFEVFGIQMNNSGISRACLLNRPYKGFTFKYITDSQSA